VRETVVVARSDRSDGSSDVRLVAYVVARGGDDAPRAGEGEEHWRSIWDATYRDSHPGDGAFNTSGWRSSFTGESIASEEMREWVDATAGRVLDELNAAGDAGAPKRVLDVGSGTGLLLFRLAPRVDGYTGVDFSPSAIDGVRAQADAVGLGNVTLECLAADGLGALQSPGTFGVVVINSVAQYFPNLTYLRKVLRLAWERVAPGGRLFVGDVRSLPHLPAFHAAVELARAPVDTPIARLGANVGRRVADDQELVLDPRLFDALAEDWPDVAEVRTELKAGRAFNEMTCFRFDAVVQKRVEGVPVTRRAAAVTAAPTPCTLDALRALLRDAPPLVRVTGVPNARVAAEVLASERMRESTGFDELTARDLLAASPSVRTAAIDPEDVRNLDPAYAVAMTFTTDRPGTFDVEFRHRTRNDAPVVDESAVRAVVQRPALESLANRPARRSGAGVAAASLVPELREEARRRLPDYMVPAAFVVLDALPRTPNGKIDRAALPAPERVRTLGTGDTSGTSGAATAAGAAPPANDTERTILRVLSELTGDATAGADDNFFDVGANSLMLVQVSVRLRELLGVPVPLVRLFQFPTARSLAASLASSDAGARRDKESAALKEGGDRAQMRRNALERQRELRARAGGTGPKR
jgi:SAM-dependent methyltransferase/acyl carrier protein